MRLLVPICTEMAQSSDVQGNINKIIIVKVKFILTFTITEFYPVEGRCLELALPDVPLTKVQKEILDDFMKNSKDNFGIDVTITIITN